MKKRLNGITVLDMGSKKDTTGKMSPIDAQYFDHDLMLGVFSSSKARYVKKDGTTNAERRKSGLEKIIPMATQVNRDGDDLVNVLSSWIEDHPKGFNNI